MRLALSLSVAMGDQGHASSLDIVYIVLQLYLPMQGQNIEVSCLCLLPWETKATPPHWILYI